MFSVITLEVWGLPMSISLIWYLSTLEIFKSNGLLRRYVLQYVS